jgi:hypothetical protein
MTQSRIAPHRGLLRHTVATLAYRAAKAVRGAPASFADFSVSEPRKTPVQILAHMGDLFDWALTLARGAQEWHDSKPFDWDKEIERFFITLQKFDDYLASDEPLQCSPEELFQGPVADALSHTGQVAMLRRMAGVPIKGENYYRAEIVAGSVGMEQAAPRREF